MWQIKNFVHVFILRSNNNLKQFLHQKELLKPYQICPKLFNHILGSHTSQYLYLYC